MDQFRDATLQQSRGSNQSVTTSSPLSRRQVLTTMGSAAAYLGLQPFALGQPSTQSTSASSQGCSPAPVPIPGGFNARQAFGPRFPDRFFHLFLPGVGSEASTIFNFQGKLAILNIHGTGTLTELNPDTGVPLHEIPNLPFATDMRFMQGTYVGVDGEKHRGTFAFFWMDVFKTGHQFGDFDFQLIDHNPGVSSNGLFWTMPIPEDTVSLDFDAGTASFCLTEALMPDLHDLLTALWGGGAVDGEGMPLGRVFSSTVSAHAVWFNAGSIQQTQDPVNQFVYINKQSNASIQWKSVRRGATFESDHNPQQVLFAAIGKERNGVFF